MPEVKKYDIASLPGDYAGKEIMPSAHAALERVGEIYGMRFNFQHALVGGAAYEETGKHLPQATIDVAKNSDAVLLGAVGGPAKGPESKLPKWDGAEREALLGLRKELGLFDNIRPTKVNPQFAHLSGLRPDIVDKGIDFEIHRELLKGIYFGKHGQSGTKEEGSRKVYQVMEYDETTVRQIAIAAFNAAMLRRKKVTEVDKANVIKEIGNLWRDICSEVAEDYPEVELDFLYVDNAAMQIISDPSQFDVMLTSNLFGDILSDEASKVLGALGLAGSASVGKEHMLFEPIHGSAPDIAGQDKVNPIAMIDSAAMMLLYKMENKEASSSIRNAIDETLAAGFATGDIRTPQTPEDKVVGTQQMTEEIIRRIR